MKEAIPGVSVLFPIVACFLLQNTLIETPLFPVVYLTNMLSGAWVSEGR